MSIQTAKLENCIRCSKKSVFLMGFYAQMQPGII